MMKREDVMQQSEESIAELVRQLEAGKSQRLIEYLSMVSRFHRYSFSNCMLIAMQRPEATMVAGFGRWKELGRFVKKGERGIAILAPLISRKKQEQDSSGSRDQTDDDRKLFGFRVVHVFDVSQTEGDELPTVMDELTGDVGDSLTHLESVVRDKRIELVYEAIPGGALGVSMGGKIAVLPELSEAEKFGVLAHELAHEMIHRGDRRAETSKTQREIEAEAVAFVVCRAAGIESLTRSADYIQLWSGDAQALMQSLELIRTVAGTIIQEMETCRSTPLEAVQHA